MLLKSNSSTVYLINSCISRFHTVPIKTTILISYMEYLQTDFINWIGFIQKRTTLSKEQHLSCCAIVFLFNNNRYVGLSHQMKYSTLTSWWANEAVPFLNQGVSGPSYILSFPVSFKENEVLNPSFSMKKTKIEYTIALTFIVI